MADIYTVTGTLTDEQTVRLDESIPLKLQKVKLVVEPLDMQAKPSYKDTILKIREGQLARGHKPPTRENVDQYLKLTRESWE